jgi:hypothetical protein
LRAAGFFADRGRFGAAVRVRPDFFGAFPARATLALAWTVAFFFADLDFAAFLGFAMS